MFDLGSLRVLSRINDIQFRMTNGIVPLSEIKDFDNVLSLVYDDSKCNINTMGVIAEYPIVWNVYDSLGEMKPVYLEDNPLPGIRYTYLTDVNKDEARKFAGKVLVTFLSTPLYVIIDDTNWRCIELEELNEIFGCNVFA